MPIDSPGAALSVFLLVAVAIPVAVVLVAARRAARSPERAGVLGELYVWSRASHRYLNLVSISRFARSHPDVWLVLLFAAAPTIAAVLTASLGRGAFGLDELASRLLPWRDGTHWAQGLAVYGGLLAVHVLVVLGHLRAGARSSDPVVQEEVSWVQQALGRPPAAVGRATAGAVLDEGGTLEEVGWRGFALPVTAAGVGGAWLATPLVALMHWAWHLPREALSIPPRGARRPWVAGQGAFLLLCTAMAVVCTGLFVATGGSALPAVLVHGASNVWSKAFGGLTPRRLVDVRTRVLVVLAVVTGAVALLV